MDALKLNSHWAPANYTDLQRSYLCVCVLTHANTYREAGLFFQMGICAKQWSLHHKAHITEHIEKEEEGTDEDMEQARRHTHTHTHTHTPPNLHCRCFLWPLCLPTPGWWAVLVSMETFSCNYLVMALSPSTPPLVRSSECTHTHTHTHTQTHILRHRHTCWHAAAQTDTNTDRQTDTHDHTQLDTNPWIQTKRCAQTNTQANIKSYTQTNTHTVLHIPAPPSAPMANLCNLLSRR